MANNIDVFEELSDEQLDMVAGGTHFTHFASSELVGNHLNQINVVIAPTVNISLFNFGNLFQSGATITQNNKSQQKAVAY